MVVLASCTSTQQVATSEYDDVYYSSSDYTERTVPDRQSNASREGYQDSRYYEDGYSRYDEDDFYYSRRLRRFSQTHNNAWRYYDPFFTNDLYYVMGTPTWNRWNSFGWYDWNRPRFGAGFSFGFGNSLWATRSRFYDPFAFNRFNSFNYYNPWVSSYYGFAPNFGYGFGNSFYQNSFFSPFGYGVGSSYLYCPPTAYVSTAAYRQVNVARRASLTSARSQTGFRRNTPSTTQASRVNTSSSSRRAGDVIRTNRSSVRSNNYLQPKTDTEKRATLSDMDRRRNAVRRTNSRRLQDIQQRSTTNSRSYPSRRSGVSSSTRRNSTINRAPSTNRRSPSSMQRRSTTPSSRNRTISPSRRPSYTPSSSRRSPSRTPSMSRPSSSRPSSMSRPSSSSSRSSSSSSRSSSGRRPPR